jgi:hypothetical protein
VLDQIAAEAADEALIRQLVRMAKRAGIPMHKTYMEKFQRDPPHDGGGDDDYGPSSSSGAVNSIGSNNPRSELGRGEEAEKRHEERRQQDLNGKSVSRKLKEDQQAPPQHDSDSD